VTGDISSVVANAGIWDMVASIDLSALSPGLSVPATVSLVGTGLTPDQVLPDFTTLTSGELVADVGALFGPGAVVTADINSVSIAVPEPSTALLLGSGLAALGAWRRRRNG